MESLTILGSGGDQYEPVVTQLLNDNLPNDWEWLGSSRNAKVASRISPPPLVYKQYLVRSFADRIKRRFLGDRATRAVRQGKILSECGFYTPGVHCWGRHNDVSFALFDRDEGIPLGTWIQDVAASSPSSQLTRSLRRVVDDLAVEVGRLHKSGIVHGDLRPNNILLSWSDERPRFVFIDNERNKLFTKIPVALIRKNLVQIGMVSPATVTARQRLRFFSAYHETYGRFSREARRAVLKSVWQKTLERFDKKGYFQEIEYNRSRYCT